MNQNKFKTRFCLFFQINLLKFDIKVQKDEISKMKDEYFKKRLQ